MRQGLFGKQGEHFSEAHKIEMWDLIHARSKCPSCHRVGKMSMASRGGLCFIMECHECDMMFMSGVFRGIGAYPIAGGWNKNQKKGGEETRRVKDVSGGNAGNRTFRGKGGR